MNFNAVSRRGEYDISETMLGNGMGIVRRRSHAEDRADLNFLITFGVLRE